MAQNDANEQTKKATSGHRIDMLSHGAGPELAEILNPIPKHQKP